MFWHFFYLNSYRRKINLVRWKNLYLFKLFWRNIKDGFTTFVITFYLAKLFIIQQSMFLLRLLNGEDSFPWESEIKLRKLSNVWWWLCHKLLEHWDEYWTITPLIKMCHQSDLPVGESPAPSAMEHGHNGWSKWSVNCSKEYTVHVKDSVREKRI